VCEAKMRRDSFYWYCKKKEYEEGLYEEYDQENENCSCVWFTDLNDDNSYVSKSDRWNYRFECDPPISICQWHLNKAKTMRLYHKPNTIQESIVSQHCWRQYWWRPVEPFKEDVSLALYVDNKYLLPHINPVLPNKIIRNIISFVRPDIHLDSTYLMYIRKKKKAALNNHQQQIRVNSWYNQDIFVAQHINLLIHKKTDWKTNPSYRLTQLIKYLTKNITYITTNPTIVQQLLRTIYEYRKFWHERDTIMIETMAYRPRSVIELDLVINECEAVLGYLPITANKKKKKFVITDCDGWITVF